MDYESFADLKAASSTPTTAMAAQTSTSPNDNDQSSLSYDLKSQPDSKSSGFHSMEESGGDKSSITTAPTQLSSSVESTAMVPMSAASEEPQSPESEPVDPRVQFELERLNKACTDINKLENELEESKNLFFQTKNYQLMRLETLQKKLGSCIQKAKPYFEMQRVTERLQLETQHAAQEFQKANSLYKTAKETLSVAEHSLNKGEIPDVWQEHLSATITKINLSKKAADQAGENHRKKAIEYQQAELRMLNLQKEYRRNIAKAQPYYEEKTRWTNQMETQKSRIYEIEQAIAQNKSIYKEAMRNLSRISEEIHHKRKLRKMISDLPPREPGVGAEKPDNFYGDSDSLTGDTRSSQSLKLDEFSPIEARTQHELETSLANIALRSSNKAKNDSQSSASQAQSTNLNMRLSFDKELEELELKELQLGRTASSRHDGDGKHSRSSSVDSSTSSSSTSTSATSKSHQAINKMESLDNLIISSTLMVSRENKVSPNGLLKTSASHRQLSSTGQTKNQELLTPVNSNRSTATTGQEGAAASSSSFETASIKPSRSLNEPFALSPATAAAAAANTLSTPSTPTNQQLKTNQSAQSNNTITNKSTSANSAAKNKSFETPLLTSLLMHSSASGMSNRMMGTPRMLGKKETK